MNDNLKEYLSKEYSIADKDLALAMIERSFHFLKKWSYTVCNFI